MQQQKGESVFLRTLVKEKWPFNELSMSDALLVLQENQIIRNCGTDEFFFSARFSKSIN